MVLNISKCPICMSDETSPSGDAIIKTITDDPINHPEVTYRQCMVCGFRESTYVKFQYEMSLGDHENGNISGFDAGDKVPKDYVFEITAVPDIDYHLKQWVVNGAALTTVKNPTLISVQQDTVVAAVFEHD